MADGGYSERSFTYGDSLDGDSSFGDTSSGIEMKSEGSSNGTYDSETQSDISWESESERSWENEEESEDEDNALGKFNRLNKLVIQYLLDISADFISICMYIFYCMFL